MHISARSIKMYSLEAFPAPACLSVTISYAWKAGWDPHSQVPPSFPFQSLDGSQAGPETRLYNVDVTQSYPLHFDQLISSAGLRISNDSFI